MEDQKVNVELSVYQAAAIREALFRSTAQDSYEFPSERTVVIREVIIAIDTKLEEVLKDEQGSTES
jgi:hypothetical protein|tara:strand:+ start:669 stop:866 length:198 start_codon:yes stop_codon:yes gene_type:complete